MKRVLAMLLAVMMIMAILSGCSHSQESSQPVSSKTGSDTTDQSSDEVGGKEKEEDITFTFFMPESGFNIPPDDNPIAEQIYDATGVRIKFEVPAADPSERLLTLLSSDTLPDVIDFVDLGNDSIQKQYIDAGKLVRLNDLLTEQAPVAWETAWPTFRDQVMDQNGDIWYFPYWYYFSEDDLTPEAEFGFNLHSDYFDHNGYDQIPHTLAELEQVLLKIKEQYPDAAPIAFALGQQGQVDELVASAAAANGLGLSNGIIRDGDDVKYFTQMPQIKDFFKQLQALNMQGLVDPDSSVMSTEMLKQRCVADLVYSYIGYGWEINSEVFSYNESIDSQNRMITLSLKQDETVEKAAYAPYTFNQFNSGIALTTGCSDPERFMRFYEYLNSEEGRLATYGVINFDFEGENTVEETEGYNFIVRKDTEFIEGRPFVEATAWQSEMFGSDENWYWNQGLYCYGYFTYAECNYPNGKYDIVGDGDVSIWWDENTTRISNELGITGTNYWEKQAEVAINITDLANLTLDYDSEEYLISTELQEIYRKYLPRTIMAESDEEFESNWAAMEQEMNDAGLAQMMTVYQELYHE